MQTSINLDFLLNESLVALASNLSADYLANAIDEFSKIANVTVSNIHTQQSTTGEIYHNQMLYICLKTALTYQELLNFSKQLEIQNNRQQFTKPTVSLDVDIVAFKTDEILQQMCDEKGKPFIQLANQWYGISRRLPLADYDKVGFDELAKQLALPILD